MGPDGKEQNFSKLDLPQLMTAVRVYNATLIFGTGGFAVFNVIAVATLVTVVMGLGAAIIWAITSNLRQGERFRQQLGERLDRLRLPGALRRFGIDPARYLHSQPITTIEDQMRKCRACEQTVRCDDTLATHVAPEDLAFCPNFPELQKLAAPSQGERQRERL